MFGRPSPYSLDRATGELRPAQRNWRLPAFCAVFLSVAAGGLFYVYSRPAEYRALAKLAITPAEKQLADANDPTIVNSKAPDLFLTEMEFLTSRPALEELSERLAAKEITVASSKAEVVEAFKRMISARVEPGTQVVHLSAVGARPEVLAPALNQLMAIYAARRGDEFLNTSQAERGQTKDELAKYDAAVLQKRKELASFRARYGIVSQERDENPTVARAKGLGTALNSAQEKAVNAQAKLRSIKAQIASGKRPTHAKDNPNLAALEQQLLQAREELGDLERRYTGNYLKREPQAVKLQKLIPALEKQLAQEKEASWQANLADAEQEAAQAQDALEKLKAQQANDESAVQTFSGRFGEYKALQEELNALELSQRRTAERMVRMEAREGSRKPQFKIVEAAATPLSPWRPDYTRDAALAVAAALGLGFLAAWLAEFLLAPKAEPFNIVVAPTPVAYPIGQPPLVGVPLGAAVSPPVIDVSAAPAQLVAPAPVLRELNDGELKALFGAADDDGRVALTALLSGVSAEELAQLCWADLDGTTQRLRIGAPAQREISLPKASCDWLMKLRAGRQALAEDGLIKPPAGNGTDVSYLESIIAYAAHDAGVESPAEVTTAAIRHTYVAYLVRQGMRFSDLARIVGPLTAETTAMYGALAGGASKRVLQPDEQVMPALRETPSALL